MGFIELFRGYFGKEIGAVAATSMEEILRKLNSEMEPQM
jgi:hypothetical protein